MAGPRSVANLALVHAWTGERDRAFEQLEIVAQTPGDAPNLQRSPLQSVLGLFARRYALRQDRCRSQGCQQIVCARRTSFCCNSALDISDFDELQKRHRSLSVDHGSTLTLIRIALPSRASLKGDREANLFHRLAPGHHSTGE